MKGALLGSKVLRTADERPINSAAGECLPDMRGGRDGNRIAVCRHAAVLRREESGYIQIGRDTNIPAARGGARGFETFASGCNLLQAVLSHVAQSLRFASHWHSDGEPTTPSEKV
jgi:hypothetical protein